MIRFGVHSSLWTSSWTGEGAEISVRECARHNLQVVEIGLLEPEAVDVQHSLSLFDRYGVAPTASLCLPRDAEATRHPEAARDFLGRALDVAHALGCNTLTGVTYSELGYRSLAAPTEGEYDAIVKALKPIAKRAGDYGMTLGLRGLQPLRDPFGQHRQTGAGAGRADRRAVRDDPPRHLSRQHRGEEFCRRAGRRRRPGALRAPLRERPRRPRLGQRPLAQRDDRAEAGGRYPLPAPVFHRLDRASFAWRTISIFSILCDAFSGRLAAAGRDVRRAVIATRLWVATSLRSSR